MRPLLIPLLLLAGCASTPVEMRGYWQPRDALQWEHPRVAGIGLESDDGSEHYLDSQVVENLLSVHDRLLKASGRRWLDLAIADARAEGEPVFNAFASAGSGGPVVAVSLGLLEVIGRDRNALAAVLGHEMAHIALGHSPDQVKAREERLQKSQQVGAGLTTGSAAVAALIYRVGALAHYRSLTREEERAADERGLQWAVQAGFDPCGMVRAQDAARTGWSAEVPFFSTHPGSEERRALANRYSREATGRDCPESATSALARESFASRPAAQVDPATRPVMQEPSATEKRFETAIAALKSDGSADAIREIRVLADGGFAPAQAELGYFYLVGGAGLPKDEAEGARWLRLAAHQGHAWAQAMLGRIYLLGRGGIEKDEHRALQLFRLSAEQGHPYGEFNVGLAYLTGLGGVEKDRLQAARYFNRAAQKGDASAQASLGQIYWDGTAGIPKNTARAAELFRLSAEQNHPRGQLALARMYYFGVDGLEQDRPEALRLYQLAAEQGEPNAQYELGWLREEGEGGLPKDIEEAVLWYRRAAAQGHKLALQSLKRLGREE